MNTNIPEILTQARWIWPEDIGWDMHNCYAQFRKPFELAAVPAAAPLFITADQSYRLYINGQFVCRGPARGYQAHWPYDEVDVRPYLRRGRNVIAVRAHNPGFSNFQYISQGAAGFLLAAQWGELKILSDNSWARRRQHGISKDTVPASMQLFCQEHFDARLEPVDWTSLEFDDSTWETGPGISNGNLAWNSMPWYTLEERQIPLLDEKQIAPGRLVGVSSGACAAGYLATRDVTRIRHNEGLAHQPATQTLQPLRVPATGKGRFQSYLIDFGHTVVGNLSLEVRGTQGGEIIDTLHVETIDAQKLEPHFLIPTHCRMAFGNRLICREAQTQHTFYHAFGFRYLVLTVRDALQPLELGLTLNWIGYPLERKGGFQSSDPALEAIWETCAWTQQCCSLDAYVDTPWREQAQWWGDARVQAWNTFHLNGDARLFRRGIGSIASQTAPNGLTYGHAPTIAHTCILPDFTLIWVMTLWDYYWQTGSLEPFLEHQAVIENALQYFAAQTGAKVGLVLYDPRYWLFLDWTAIFREGYPTVLNLWLLLVLEKVAAMHRLTGAPEKAEPLEQWHARLAAVLLELADENGLFRDGRTPDGAIVPSTSIHSQTLAILAGLRPQSERTMLDKILLPYIREEIKLQATPSAYWATYVFSVLAQRGHGREVIEFIKKYWAPMAAHGTTWENFAPQPGNESYSHAWSAHPLFHFAQIIGGINQTAPAWQKIRFSPVFYGQKGGASVPSPRGLIRSQWQRNGAKVEVELTLPPGVEARVELPGIEPYCVTETHCWTLDAAD